MGGARLELGGRWELVVWRWVVVGGLWEVEFYKLMLNFDVDVDVDVATLMLQH